MYIHYTKWKHMRLQHISCLLYEFTECTHLASYTVHCIAYCDYYCIAIELILDYPIISWSVTRGGLGCGPPGVAHRRGTIAWSWHSNIQKNECFKL